MKILLIGNGGREHALARQLLMSPLLTELWVTPANAGIAEITKTLNIKADDISALVQFAIKEKIDFVLSGGETPLVLGLWDAMKNAGIACLGPSLAAAQLEGSKIWMKQLCQECRIPTARYQHFTDLKLAKNYAAELWQNTKSPIVIKTDGLAGGKGVIIANDLSIAERALTDMLITKKFGKAGEKIIIEEFLLGREMSYFILTDGKNYVELGSAEDHKQAFDGDLGPNTGGMGAFSPSPILTPKLNQQIKEEIVKPLLKGLAAKGSPYMGILFFGLMVQNDYAKLLEINIRLGDPEAQVILPLLKSDFLTAVLSTERGVLDDFSIEWNPYHAVAVVFASKGYPNDYKTHQPIILPQKLNNDCFIFHAGTIKAPDGTLLSNGGRVLTATALAEDRKKAIKKAYELIATIKFNNGFFRHDIGKRNY